jgi:translocation and assembly module TamB
MRLRDVSAQGFAIHEVEAKGAYTALGWAVEAVRVRQTRDAGELLATGTISRKGELNLQAVTNGVTLSRFDLPELRRLGVEGDAFVTVDVGGTIQQPSGVGRVVLSNFKLRNQPQEDTRFDFNLRGDRVDLEGHLLGERVALNARLQVKRPFPFAGQVTVRDLDVGLFAGPEIGQRLAPLSGRGELTGLATRLRDTKGRFIVDVVKADLGPNYSLRNKRPLVLRIEGERVTLEPVELAGRETLFAVSGSRLPSGEIDFNVDGRADFRLLGFYLPRLQRPAGLLRLKLRIGGTPAEPSFLGSGEILQGRFGVETFPHRLTDVEGKLVFTQNRVVVQELTGKFADGTLRGDGEVELARFVPSSFRFNVKLDEAALRFPEFLPARVAGNLQLTGTPAEQVLSGEIQVLRARFTRDIKLEELILKRKRIVPQVFEKSKDRLRMDVRVVARDDIRVINNIGDLEFQAEGGVRGSVTRPIPYGIVRLARPANVRFFKKLFKIERIYVVAKEEDRIDPYFDVEGVTRVRNIDIILTIKGRLSDYKLDFTCGAGLSTADCLSLMQVGLTLKELNAVQPGKTGISTAVDAISGLVGFDEKVAERLPIFDTFRIGSGYSEYSAAIVPLVTIGKELPGGIRLYGTTSLIDPSKDFRAQVEYDIVKNLSGVLEFVNLPRTGASGSTVGSSFGNLGVDLRWRFEF